MILSIGCREKISGASMSRRRSPFKKAAITAALATSAFVLCLVGTPNAFASGAGSRPSSKWIIAVQPTATATALSDQAKELESFLESKLGRDIEVLFPTSYAGVVEALRYGHAHAAFMGAWPARLAEQTAGASVLLAEVREVMVDGKLGEAPNYRSFWIVAPDSPYQTLADLKGKKAAFPSPISTSGYVAPLDKLVSEKLITRPVSGPADPKAYFSEVLFAGGYPQGFEALKAGQVDVTVIAGDVPEKLFTEVLAVSRVIAEQGPIPSHAVVVSKALGAADRERLASALLELNAPEHRPLMRKFVSGIFVRFERAGTGHLAALAGMLDRTGLEFAEKK